MRAPLSSYPTLGLWAALLSLSWLALPCPAQTLEAPARGPGNLRELETFLDNFFSKRMKELHVPGAAFVLVREGKIYFAKGYGFADRQHRRVVDPERTLFRVASVSKLFTATAVMQLAERGRLHLHEDVNRYLKGFQLESNYPAPVTLANLLTHTGGFDERFVGIAARHASEALPLGFYLAARMPPRVLPPGDLISYSNHGMAHQDQLPSNPPRLLAGRESEAVSKILEMSLRNLHHVVHSSSTTLTEPAGKRQVTMGPGGRGFSRGAKTLG